MERKRVIALVGPTGTGKTSLSLALAKKLDGEIIACDSRTVYKYFDIGTAKPTPEQRSSVPHHLLDVVEPEESYTAARFADDAATVIQKLAAGGKTSIICGGTGFYFRALLEGLCIPAVPPQEELRRELHELAEQEGNSVLKERLSMLDPEAAGRLNVNDRFRLVRALEVCIVTGKPFSTLAVRQESPYETLWIGLTVRDRQVHKELLKQRIAVQMKDGMLEEACLLYKRYGPAQKLLKTVNYSDLVAHIEGRLSLSDCMSECERHNFQLARRQTIWFKTNPLINWVYVDEANEEKIYRSALILCERFLSG